MGFSKLCTSARCLSRGILYHRSALRFSSGEAKTEVCEENKEVDSTKKGLVLGVYESGKKFELTPAAEEVNQKSGGKICAYLNQLSCAMKLGKAFVVTDLLPEYTAVALSSLGPRDPGYNELEALDETRENIRWSVGAGVRALMSRGCGHIEVAASAEHDAAAEAATLASWKFQEFKSCLDRKAEPSVHLYGPEGGEMWRRGAVRGDAQNWARFLSDMPANRMTPVDLAQAALDKLCPLGVAVEAHDREWIEAQRMNAFLAVARGSCDTPIFLECAYNGGRSGQPPVLIVAKGVTFDSGGLCLKHCSGMTENRGSMAGAAAALGALLSIAQLKIPINIRLAVPICENMVSGQCMKVGDVVTALNGLNIQIENTDMEGRLLLADALVFAQAQHRPRLVLDVATFTKGVRMATGGAAFGCFSNSAAAWKAVQAAGASAGDRAWRLPLWTYYQQLITNDPSVDLRNQGAGTAAPCLGAAFLKNFICGDWVHMDITGVGKVAHTGAAPYFDPRRMTGRPTRTLAVLLEAIAASSQAEVKEAKEACVAK